MKELSMRICSTVQQLPRSPGGNTESSFCRVKCSPSPASAPQHCIPGSSYTKSSNAPPETMPLSRQDFALARYLCLGHPSLDPHGTPPHFPRRFSNQPLPILPTPFHHPPCPWFIFLPVLATSDILIDFQGHQSLPHPGMSAPRNLIPPVHCNFHSVWNSARLIVCAQIKFVDSKNLLHPSHLLCLRVAIPSSRDL